jgi:hypothetical protein
VEFNVILLQGNWRWRRLEKFLLSGKEWLLE